MTEYQWRDIGDGKPVRVQVCPMCGVAPTNVDDCGEFGNPECPYFGIGLEDYEKLCEGADLQELLKDKARLDWLADVDNKLGGVTLPRAIVERNLHSMRDAIDEAMAIDSKAVSYTHLTLPTSDL